MSSPFQFLQAYRLEDKDKFFGREKETEALYQMSYKSPLLLVYGLSGTGKTSLIQCGLASRFDGPDWLPIFIRRQENINDSLRQALAEVFPAEEPMPEQLPEVVSYLYRYYLRPVYLIFDQFEELFILGNWEERQQFIRDLRDLMTVQSTCRIILTMREEYIGQLYDFEKVIPSLFDFRLRLEPMNTTKVKEVMQQSFRQFNIKLEPPEEERLQQMVDQLSDRKSGVQLPYLQVYLDLLYREDFKRTYRRERVGDELPELVFTKQEIKDFGTIEEVLEKFLLQQEREITAHLQANFEHVPQQTVRRVLDVFATEDGTKRPVRYRREGEKIILTLPVAIQENIADISAEVLTSCLESLEQSRLLRFADKDIELAHDSLAALIDGQRSDKQKQLNEIKRRLRNNYIESKQTGEYLSQKQLNAYEEYLSEIKDEDLLTFIADSRADVEEKERAEEIRKQKELRQTRFFLGIVSVVAIIAFVLGAWALQKRQEAVQAREELSEKVLDNYLQNSQALRNEGKYDEAIQPMRDALDLTGDERERARFSGMIDTLQRIADYVTTADSLVADSLSAATEGHRLPEALRLYESASELLPGGLLDIKINQTSQRIDEAFRDAKERGLNLQPVGCQYALPLLLKANQLKPGDAKVETAIRQCEE
jgi:hypothetical protein